MNSIKHIAVAFAATFVLSAVVCADDANPAATLPPAATKAGVTYATDMKPIFDASCVKCHSGDRPKARLKMDTLEGVLKGTKEGKIVTPGDSANSMMVKSIAHL